MKNKDMKKLQQEKSNKNKMKKKQEKHKENIKNIHLF